MGTFEQGEPQLKLQFIATEKQKAQVLLPEPFRTYLSG
ncbi:hypothetical protein AVDCRST_MAG81-2574 [uncultured Synechococcales cyanobacterium]|uniref:Uncharacterized protein n=1 Tax=uncultured Synechococcales cyanobacterium TaxID=1936017 RepID=A0A6J4VI90_9CYAN|nr:hypothetical protein AVDCRST_MAG81-2574 [uncultured Synechococcales cyanobacterium]